MPMSPAQEMFQRHRATLDAAVAALSGRDYWTPYPETPSGRIYGETANAEARAAFEARRGKPFALDQAGPSLSADKGGTVGAGNEQAYMREMFGPIAFVVAARDVDDAIARAARSASAKGAITWSAYSTDAGVLARVEAAALEAGVALSCNLTGGVFVNQAAAFSDYHVTGRNPAGNAALTDAAFVARRFHVVQVRRPAPAPAAAA